MRSRRERGKKFLPLILPLSNQSTQKLDISADKIDNRRIATSLLKISSWEFGVGFAGKIQGRFEDQGPHQRCKHSQGLASRPNPLPVPLPALASG
jgi:hypothetical protein